MLLLFAYFRYVERWTVPVLPLFVPGRHNPVEDQRPLLTTAGLGHGLEERVAQGDGEPPAVLVHLGLGDGALRVQEELQGVGRPGPGSVVGGRAALVTESSTETRDQTLPWGRCSALQTH